MIRGFIRNIYHRIKDKPDTRRKNAKNTVRKLNYNRRYINWNRNAALCILFFFLFSILTLRLALLQIVRGEEYKSMAENLTTRLIPLKAPRGVIFDRNGEVLAGNRPCYNVDIYQSDLIKGDANSSIIFAIETLDRYGDEYINNFPIKAVLNQNSGETELVYEWSDNSEEQPVTSALNWFKLYNFPDTIKPREAFERLVKNYNIEDSYSIEQKLKILAIWNELKLSGYRAYLPVTIARDISRFSAAVLEENLSEIPGVNLTPSYIRQYPNGNLASHVIGYMGVITAEDWAANKEYYTQNGYDPVTDLVGRWEMEYVLEPYLHGRDGGWKVKVDASGRNTGTLEVLDPIPGNDVYLTLDLKLQRVLDRALTNSIKKIRNGAFGERFPNAHVGSAVVVDINTGQILALVNKPDYDPNAFVTGRVDSDVWKSLNPSYPDPNNPDRESLDPTLPRPLVNNAVRGIFPPGSTFKMLVGLAGLEEGEIKPDSIIFDQGRYTKYSSVNSPACWIWNMYKATHGQVDIVSGMRDSCNYFFYELGDRLGIDVIESYARKFGLGKKTGIELPFEAEGIIAGPEHINSYIQQIVRSRIVTAMGIIWQDTDDSLKESINKAARACVDDYSMSNIENQLKKLGLTLSKDKINRFFYSFIRDARWNPAKTLSASIGQAENTFTPIQIAAYMATLSNGGTRYKCYLTDKVISYEGKAILNNKPEVLDRIEMSSENYEAIMLGMHAVTSGIYKNIPGTAARYLHGFNMNIAGKTGSAQFPGRDSYGWFVACAPYENPEIAVAVMVAQAGSGGYVVEVARAVFEEYFKQGTALDSSLRRNRLYR